jgi:uncharacterized membrane protein (DUF4010 family)
MLTDTLAAFYPFLTSLGLGLLIGLERERAPTARAGLRTFALVALAGTLCALLSERTGTPWMLAVGLLAVSAMIVSAYAGSPEQNDYGTTTIAAVVVCYALGAMVWYDFTQVAVSLAVLTTALLYFKAELRGVTQSLTRQDMVSIYQFGILSLVILPVLPNRPFGPYDALNPYHIWMMVVLISGLSLAGYAALRFTGERKGTLLTGLFGGLASSTATTLAFSKHGREAAMTPLASLVILTANWVLPLRICVLVIVLSPAFFVPILTVFGPGVVAGIWVVWRRWRLFDQRTAQAPRLEMTNPAEIKAALGFGMLFAIVLLASAWLNDWVGSSGIYAVAAASGSTDMDAITLSTLRLLGLASLTEQQAATAILIAYLANALFKSALALSIGGRGLARQVWPGMGLMAAGCIGGWLLISV